MSRAQIEQQIRDYLANKSLLGRADMLQTDTVLLGNILDSMGTLELIGFLQQNFSIVMDDEDMVPENLDSISRIVDYVDRKLLAKN